MTTSRKHHTKTAAKKRPAPAAARRHHTDPVHPAEVDINMKSGCPELRFLLTVLRPLLREAVRAAKRCKHHHPHHHKVFAGNYHNITACDGRH